MYAVGKQGESLKERRKAERRKFNFIASSLCSRASGFGFCSCYTLFSGSPKCLFRGGCYRFQLLLSKPSRESRALCYHFDHSSSRGPAWINRRALLYRPVLMGHGSTETALFQLIRVFSCILLLWCYYTPSLLPFDSPTCLDRRAQPFSVFPFLFGSFWELRLTLKGSSSYFHFIYMDHSSVYKITFFFFTLPIKRGRSLSLIFGSGM